MEALFSHCAEPLLLLAVHFAADLFDFFITIFFWRLPIFLLLGDYIALLLLVFDYLFDHIAPVPHNVVASPHILEDMSIIWISRWKASMSFAVLFNELQNTKISTTINWSHTLVILPR